MSSVSSESSPPYEPTGFLSTSDTTTRAPDSRSLTSNDVDTDVMNRATTRDFDKGSEDIGVPGNKSLDPDDIEISGSGSFDMDAYTDNSTSHLGR